MPLYQYQCECGQVEEMLLTFGQAEANPFYCPECHKRMTRLVVAPFNFTFKGGKPSQEGVSKVNPKARRVRV